MRQPGGVGWQPTPPPARGQTDPAVIRNFHAYILAPGFSNAFHAATLSKSLTTIATYRAKANTAAQADPTIWTAVQTFVESITPDDGLRMAQVRGDAQMPHWSRLSIRDFRKAGWKITRIAEEFRCSPGTVHNILAGKGTGYASFSGERRLTSAQAAPVGSWQKHNRVLPETA